MNWSCPGERIDTSGGREEVGKGGRRVNTSKKCVHVHVNAKTIPVEIVPCIGGEGK
jgi:hypothetical protein